MLVSASKFWARPVENCPGRGEFCIEYIDGLVQDRRNSIANALEVRLSRFALTYQYRRHLFLGMCFRNVISQNGVPPGIPWQQVASWPFYNNQGSFIITLALWLAIWARIIDHTCQMTGNLVRDQSFFIRLADALVMGDGSFMITLSSCTFHIFGNLIRDNSLSHLTYGLEVDLELFIISFARYLESWSGIIPHHTYQISGKLIRDHSISDLLCWRTLTGCPEV